MNPMLEIPFLDYEGSCAVSTLDTTKFTQKQVENLQMSKKYCNFAPAIALKRTPNMEKKMSNKKKSKHFGQVFTPAFLVDAMLSYVGYEGSAIFKKHIIDNSCGNGAFLSAAITRYCDYAVSIGYDIDSLKEDLETYFHGIDIDCAAYAECLINLNKLVARYGIYNVKWDIYNNDSLTMRNFDGLMDFVVGNPPYVRVHNLDTVGEEVKQYKFANGGMTDLYLAFFELGFSMLNASGKLCYITPNSWLNSVAASNLRQYILEKKNLVSLTDLEHFQAFENATAYTIISLFSNDKYNSNFDYYTFNGKTLQREFVANIALEDCYIDNYFYLSSKSDLEKLRKMKAAPKRKYVSVKNGFATLADNAFIGNDIPESAITIQALKASTGKWYKCLFPYDSNGKPLPKEVVFSEPQVAAHYEAHKEEILKQRPEFPGWWEFGRTQALLDVWRDKLAINALCRTEKDLKVELVKKGQGLYSGLYIITNCDVPFDVIESILVSPDFINYVKLLRKYKSGGYYTFNSKDVEQYINSYLTYKQPVYADRRSISYADSTLF